MDNHAYNMRKAAAFKRIDAAIAQVLQLRNGQRLADELGLIKDAIVQVIHSPNSNQLAEKFELIEDAIAQKVAELFNGNQLAEAAADEEKFESNCNFIISMLFQTVGADNGGRDDLAALGIGADDRLSSLPRSATHARHSHELKLRTLEACYTCDGCKLQGCGLRYSCEQCSFNLHLACTLRSPTDPAIGHKFLGSPNFKLLYQRPKVCKNDECRECYRNCEACAKPAKGYVYCEEGKEKDRGIIFHPCCFTLPRNFSAEGIEYELCEELSSNCRLCKRKQLVGAETGNDGWAYVSKGCEEEYNIHVFCMMRVLHEKDQKDGDSRSLVLKNNTNAPIKKRGKKFCKIMTSFFKVVLSFLLGDPFNTLVGIAGLVYDLASE